jgi:hypothetical protein
MRLEMTPLSGIGWVRGGAYGQFQAEFYMNMRGLLVEVAKDAFLLVGVLIVDVIADFGLQIRGDLGAAAPQLALWALGQAGPFDA